MNKQLNCTLETRMSSKTNKPYQCIVIKLTDTYEKLVFLTSAELALLAQNDNFIG